jgi:hypothetical protein
MNPALKTGNWVQVSVCGKFKDSAEKFGNAIREWALVVEDRIFAGTVRKLIPEL